MKRTYGSARGFTLIELLVVIVIIGMLAALIIPTVRGAMNSAKKGKAMSQIRDLDGAIKQYCKEYNNKPPAPAGTYSGGALPDDKLFEGAEQAKIIEILTNTGTATNLNAKQIVFLELDPEAFKVKTATEVAALLAGGTSYKDPWDGDYRILLDLNFDDKISGVGGLADIRAKVGVYSLGDPKDKYDIATTPYKTW